MYTQDQKQDLVESNDFDKYFNDTVADYIDTDDTSEYNLKSGSYKLSKGIIERILPQEVSISTSKERVQNITDCELQLLIYFSHICNSKGQVKFINYREVVENTNLSVKSYYNALRGLKLKQYITIYKVSTGCYNITILNNDFNTKKSYKKRYVNTNNESFIKGTLTNDKFSRLSLNAKKTLLYLLLNYNPVRGFIFSTSTLSSYLGIKSSYLISGYLSELKVILGNDFCSKRFNRNKVNIVVHARLTQLQSNQSIHETQWTFEKRLLHKYITHNKIAYLTFQTKDCSENMQIHKYLNNLYNFISNYSESLGKCFIKKVIYHILLYYGKVDIGKIKVISKILSTKSKYIKQSPLQNA